MSQEAPSFGDTLLGRVGTPKLGLQLPCAPGCCVGLEGEVGVLTTHHEYLRKRRLSKILTVVFFSPPFEFGGLGLLWTLEFGVILFFLFLFGWC